MELTAEMLVLGGAARGRSPRRARAVAAAIADGRGLAKLEEIVAAQGGDPRRDPRSRAAPARPAHVRGPRAGGRRSSRQIDAEALGLAAVALGAGRARVEDRVDPAVGIVVHKRLGDRVERGEPLCTVHEGDRSEPRGARRRARRGGVPDRRRRAPPPPPLVLERRREG